MEQILQLEKMNPAQILNFIKSISLDERQNLIKNPNLINLSNDKFRFIVFNLTDEEFKLLIEDSDVYSKIMNLNDRKRSILTTLENTKFNFFKLMFENENSIKYASVFVEYLLKIDKNKFKKISTQVNIENVVNNYFDFSNENEINKFLTTRFKRELDSNYNDIFNTLLNKLKNKKINLSGLIKIKNYKELILYAKFGVLLDVDNSLDEITLQNGFVIPFDKIIHEKDGKINKIVELLRSKGESNDLELLEASLKLYYVFGFDYSKKIIEDKFTNMTESAINKIAEFNYKDDRREYRAKNQKKFYYYGMVLNVLYSLTNGSNEIFECLSYYGGEEVQLIRKEFLSLLENSNNETSLKASIKDLLKEFELDIHSLVIKIKNSL